MNFFTLRKNIQIALSLTIPILLYGCGGGGSGGTTNDVVVNVPSVAITAAGNGVFVVKGNNLEKVGGIDLTVTYDNSNLASPTVTQGGLIAGAMMMPNTSLPGAVRIAVISTSGISGDGEIATITFAVATEVGTVSLASLKMINVNGRQIL